MFLYSNGPLFSRGQVHCHFIHEDVPDFPMWKSTFFSQTRYSAIPLKVHVLYSTLNYIYLWVCFLTLTMPPACSMFSSKALRMESCEQHTERQIAVWWINSLRQWIGKYKFGATCNYHQVSHTLSGHINNWKCLHHKEFLLASSKNSPSNDENGYFPPMMKMGTSGQTLPCPH